MIRHPGGEAATRKLISAAALAPGARVIDLGAGDGEAVRLLRSLGYARRGHRPRAGADVVYGDILSPPFGPGSFDAALSQCSLLLTGDVPGAFASARRLLRPGGAFMYSDVVPGGLAALAGLARPAGFELLRAEDVTDEWRAYYIEASGAARRPRRRRGAKNCRYLAAVLRKEV